MTASCVPLPSHVEAGSFDDMYVGSLSKMNFDPGFSDGGNNDILGFAEGEIDDCDMSTLMGCNVKIAPYADSVNVPEKYMFHSPHQSLPRNDAQALPSSMGARDGHIFTSTGKGGTAKAASTMGMDAEYYFKKHEPSMGGHRGSGMAVSHSSVEKQRRDRINTLLDQLRDLVPPSGPAGGAGVPREAGVTKRPKHAVLTDTINLIKSLSQKVQKGVATVTPPASGVTPTEAVETVGTGPPAAASPCKPKRHSPSSSGSEDSSGDVIEGSRAESEARTQPSPLEVCVEKVEGSNRIQIKISCEDRRGLLLDITQAIKSMPLEIQTAAIRSVGSGRVVDVFEVVVEEGAALDMHEITARVQGVVEGGVTAVTADYFGPGGSAPAACNRKKRKGRE